MLIYVLQKSRLYVGGANEARAEQWQKLPLAVAQWKEINSVNSVIIFYPSWPNYWGQNIKVFITRVNSDWFTSVYMQVFTKWSHFSKWALPSYTGKKQTSSIVSCRTISTAVEQALLGSLTILWKNKNWQIANMTKRLTDKSLTWAKKFNFTHWFSNRPF